MPPGDEVFEGESDGEKLPIAPKAEQHAQPPSQRASGWLISRGAKPGGTISTAVDEN